MLLIRDRCMGEYGIEEDGVIHCVITEARTYSFPRNSCPPHEDTLLIDDPPSINSFNTTPQRRSAEPRAQGFLEPGEHAPDPHGRGALRSLDAALSLPALIFLEVDRAALALQRRAHVSHGLALLVFLPGLVLSSTTSSTTAAPHHQHRHMNNIVIISNITPSHHQQSLSFCVSSRQCCSLLLTRCYIFNLPPFSVGWGAA